MQLISNYHLRTKCGEGDDGVVWKAVRRDDAGLYAVKILRAPLHEIADVNGAPKEANIMETLSVPGHPNLVQYHGWGKIHRSDMITAKQEHYCCFTGGTGAFIVMEWIEGVTLERKINHSSFGRNKRRHTYTQLLEAVKYMNSICICHGSLFLDNIMISKPRSSTSLLPRLVVYDFSSASRVSAELGDSIAEMKLDKDRRQCGGVLLALFSGANIDNQVVTNRLMQKDAFLLARDLIDIRSPLSVEAALRTPFLTHNMPEDKFSVPHSVLWNDEIVESIAFNIISTGDVKDFASASLVCKQFFIVFQRQFLCAPKFPHLAQPALYDRCTLPLDARVEECSMWFERLPYRQDWKVLQGYSEGDVPFEQELLESYFQSIIEEVAIVQNLITNFTEDNHSWRDTIVRFHSIKGSCSYVGQDLTLLIAWYARDRARQYSYLNKPYHFVDEKKLYLCMTTRIIEHTIRFLKEAKVYLIQNGLDLHFHSSMLM